QQKEIENECLSNSIVYTVFKGEGADFYNKVTVRNTEQFNLIFPYLYANGSMNNFASFSLGKDVFSIGHQYIRNMWGKNKKTETPVVILKENTTIFWIDYDGDGMVVISNDTKYSGLTSVIKTLPKEIAYSIIDNGD